MVRLSSKAGGYLPNIGMLLLHENFHLIMMNINKIFGYNGNFSSMYIPGVFNSFFSKINNINNINKIKYKYEAIILCVVWE